MGDLEPFAGPRIFFYAQQRKDWVKVSSELTQGYRAWADGTNSNGDVASTRPGLMSPLVQVSKGRVSNLPSSTITGVD